MPQRCILPFIKQYIFLFLLLCVSPTNAQKNIEIVDSPISTIGVTTAKITTVNILSDSIVFVQIEIIPSSDLETLPNGISEKTVMRVGEHYFPINNVAQVIPGSMFPLQSTDGFQGWHDAKANNAYNVILTFIVPSMGNVESFSILSSPSHSGSEKGYYSFEDVKLNQSGSEKAYATTTVKSVPLYSGPSVKSRRMSKLSKGEKICLLEDKGENNSSNGDRNSKDEDSKLCKVIVLSTAGVGFIEKDALSQERNPLEFLTDVVKLSKKGPSISDGGKNTDMAQIEFHNNTLTPVTLAINDAHLTIDPLKTGTFRIRIQGNSQQEGEVKYLVVKSQGLPPMIVRCNLTGGDSYYWEFIRANTIG